RPATWLLPLLDGSWIPPMHGLFGYPLIQTGAELESRARSEVIWRTDAGPDEPTVHSWKWPPGLSGARKAMVLPSGENEGEATMRPLTSVAGEPRVRLEVSRLATSSSADWLEPLVHTMAISFSSGETAGCPQPASALVSAAPSLPARRWIQTWECTWKESSIENLV